MSSELLEYGIRVTPGLLLITASFFVAGNLRDPLIRILLLILGFVLIRDAMTPLGFWTFGSSNHLPWLRFTEAPGILVTFGIVSLALTAFILWRAPDLRQLVCWGTFRPSTLAMGIGGGALAAGPFLLLTLATPIGERGGEVAVSFLPVLLFFALAGNLGEEVLFRGFLQGRLEQTITAVRAAVFSGLFFATCHIFLASTVTDIGWPILMFTLWEGLICAFLRMWRGVIPAALAHGLAIFLLSSGLI